MTVLFTGPFEVEDGEYWKRRLGETEQIEFVELAMVGGGHRWNGSFGCTRRSRAVAEFLELGGFDAVHFQEWQGNGFVPMQRRRTMGVLKDVVMTVMLHSSSEWIAEGARLFRRGSMEEMVQDYAERYAVEHADMVLSPSQYMFDWAAGHGWKMPERCLVMPYLIEEGLRAEVVEMVPDEVVFFGRLETRKGLEIFCEAVSGMVEEGAWPPGCRVTFLGKQGSVSGGRGAGVYLQGLKARIGDRVGIEVIDQLDHVACQALLCERPNALVVMPSLQDNYPFAVLECLQLGQRILTSRIGGIPEMVDDEESLVEPTSRALREALRRRLAVASGGTKSRYDLTNVREQWEGFFEGMGFLVSRENGAVPELGGAERVTICVPHFNHGAGLKELLKSLEDQTVEGFGVVVVDDGSTDEDSVEAFESLAKVYEGRGWRFLRKKNEGIGKTRNLAAQQASTEFLMFMDADNVARPCMVEGFARAMERSGCDGLASYYLAFEGECFPGEDKLSVKYGYMPVGPCLEAGFLDNVFGDANFILRRKVFEEVGGFGEERGTSCEDWELLARLALKGYRLDVVPEVLFFYRHAEGGFSRSTSNYFNHLRAIQPYLEGATDWQRRAIFGMIGGESPSSRYFRDAEFDQLRSKIRQLNRREARLEAQLEREVRRHERTRAELGRMRSRPRGVVRIWAKLLRMVRWKGERIGDDERGFGTHSTARSQAS